MLRQQYALKMLDLLEHTEGEQKNRRRIINIDESWLNETTFYRKIWMPKNEACSVPS